MQAEILHSFNRTQRPKMRPSAGTHPEFIIMTGICTDALVALNAFLGPDYDMQIEEIYTKYFTDDLTLNLI
jgi:hypothetical protein